MHLYHANCSGLKLFFRRLCGYRGVPKYVMIYGSDIGASRTYKCEVCGNAVHVDLDWEDDGESRLDLKRIMDNKYDV